MNKEFKLFLMVVGSVALTAASVIENEIYLILCALIACILTYNAMMEAKDD